jgi:hypothetical protein
MPCHSAEFHKSCWHPRSALEDEDSCRGPMSPQFELSLIDRLLTLSESCDSPTLKAWAPALNARKRKLQSKLEARAAEPGAPD